MKKNSSNNIDANLVIEYQSGNNKALALLVKRWHKEFCKLAFWYVKDKHLAKDVAQESWILIFNKLQTLQEPEKFKSWAISIVNRKAIDFLRKSVREKKKLVKKYNETSKNIFYEDENDEKSKQLAILKQAIELLNEQQKIVIKLFYVEEYSLKEISKILNISAGTAKSRLFYAREKLKLTLKHRKNE